MYINLRQLAVLENGCFGQPKKQIFGLDHKKQIDAMTFSLKKTYLFSQFFIVENFPDYVLKGGRISFAFWLKISMIFKSFERGWQ